MTATVEQNNWSDERHDWNDVAWSSKAVVPPPGLFRLPVPGTRAFQKAHGRSGDLVVIQIQGGENEKEKRQAALRTLGLSRRFSASLRNSHDPATWGNINLVQDLVSVVDLGSTCYKGFTEVVERGANEITLEHYKYGTDSQPAGVWRNDIGEYFAFEASRLGMLAFWSSDMPIRALVATAALSNSGLDKESSEFYISGRANEGIVQRRCTLKDLQKALHEEVDLNQVVLVQPNGNEITWRAPFQRFHDVDGKKGQVGLFTPARQNLEPEWLIRATAEREFFAEAHCVVEFREHGVLRSKKIKI